MHPVGRRSSGAVVPFFLVLVFLCTHSAFSQTTNEAETASLSGNASVEDCSFCSGEKSVANIGGPDNGAVAFLRIIVHKPGLYPVTVNVNVGDDRSLRMTVNNEAYPRWLLLQKRGRGNRITTRTIFMPFREGSNTIRFDNPHEPGPDLDNIVVAPEPVESFRISGTVPVPGVQVRLSGDLDQSTFADSSGHYEFPFLPKGKYHVSAIRPEMDLAPIDRYYASLTNDMVGQNFTISQSTIGTNTVRTWGHWRLECGPRGLVTIYRDGALLLSNIYAEIHLPETISTLAFPNHTVKQNSTMNSFGTGLDFVVESAVAERISLVQTFSLSPNFILVSAKVSVPRRISSRFIAPLVTHAPVELLPSGDNRALWVPFDNDKWVRYVATAFSGNSTSDEVAAFYNSETRAGLIVGSVEHDTWKTGVESSVSNRSINSLEVFGGYTSVATRDVAPHGFVSGNSISSPKIFIGYFPDWRRGLETYAAVNASLAPPVPWTNGVPFGWNSWGKLQFALRYSNAIPVSDFFASQLQPHHFENNGVAYIGLDSGWDRFSDVQLKDFVDHCRSNHQEAGIYCAPFAEFGAREGPLLLANGLPQRVDGGTALDPTDPRTRDRIRQYIEKFKRAGFTYLKIDFLAHGALEADHYYDPSVTTGMQAYNSGMKFLRDTIGGSMYLNEAISPLFPGRYAQSRRIACDAFGAIDQTEYTLNAVTYGWWLNRVYDFLDPDEIVLEGFTEGENRARVTSAVITGLMLSGDDLSNGSDRAKKYLANDEINQLAAEPKSFAPVEGNSGTRAANVFAGKCGKTFCIAVFNYSSKPSDFDIDLRRAGWTESGAVTARELWTGATVKPKNNLHVHLASTDAALYRLDR
jgi:alpha-galactosidase